MEIRVIREKITKEELRKTVLEFNEEMIKAVVDIEKEIIALGGELHSDANNLLIEKGSKQENLCGINIYPDKSEDELIEFSALINIRPSIGNRSMKIENSETREKIKEIVNKLIS